jgi:ferredoxin-NADP reductase
MADGALAANRAFVDYKVVARTRESDVISAFTLAPVGGGAVPAYRPGQYLVFRLTINGVTVLRNYSVSGDSADTQVLRIAVKREPAPSGTQWPGGVGSNHLHDHIHVGDILSAAGPMGDFVLAEDSERPVVLFSGGVGLTPMMCMLHRLVASSRRRVFFIHACENGKAHAFADEVLALAAQREGVSVHFCYREPTAADRESNRFHSEGLIGREQVQALLPLDDYDFYLCGPSPFMQANWRLLRDLGVDKQRIHYEFFGPATVLEAEVQDESAPAILPAFESAPVGDAPEAQVRFMPSGTSMAWNDECESLLELAEQAGLNPDFNCRAGLCNTCMSTLVSGEVDYFEPPLDEPPQGRVLLCCSRPRGPVVIELGA